MTLFSAAPSPTVAVASGNLSRDLYFTFSSLLFFFQPSPRFFGLCFSHFIKSLFVHSFNCICTVKLALVAISLGTFLFPFTSFNWDPRPFLRWSSFICTPLEFNPIFKVLCFDHFKHEQVLQPANIRNDFKSFKQYNITWHLPLSLSSAFLHYMNCFCTK